MHNPERRQKINVGDVLHIIQIAVLLASLGVAYEKFDQTAHVVENHSKQLDRVEHYLSSKDPNYWKIVKDE